MKKALSILLAACMAVSMAACGGAASSSAAAGSTAAATGAAIKLGGIGPVTGGAAVYGIAVKNGAELAVEEINAMGGIQFDFKFEDDEHDSEKAVNAYNALKDWGMQILMGTVTSTPCIAVAQETYTDNMFQLTPSGTAVDCVKYDNAFRMCFSDPNQGIASAKYIGDNKLATKVGIIFDSSDVYSSGIKDSFITQSKESGIEVVATEAFTADSKTDFSVQIQKMQAAGAELVFLPIYYTEASIILKQCSNISYQPGFFGCDGMDGLLGLAAFDTSLAEGLVFLSPFAANATDDATKSFVDKYKAAYTDTPNQFAADAYDAIYAIKAACEKAGITADMDASAMCDLLKTAITSISFTGLTGKDITWSADGELSKEPIVLKVESGEYTVMK